MNSGGGPGGLLGSHSNLVSLCIGGGFGEAARVEGDVGTQRRYNYLFIYLLFIIYLFIFYYYLSWEHKKIKNKDIIMI